MVQLLGFIATYTRFRFFLVSCIFSAFVYVHQLLFSFRCQSGSWSVQWVRLEGSALHNGLLLQDCSGQEGGWKSSRVESDIEFGWSVR
ncbi:hypothetical protein VTL71DRAFT_15284 [Oculimacula yallundae]|uniref:Secreted protein n=1 Tax=Oculimacula yallundae TaxID=86028 RepID=A0ABR4CHF2_9HELO